MSSNYNNSVNVSLNISNTKNPVYYNNNSMATKVNVIANWSKRKKVNNSFYQPKKTTTRDDNNIYNDRNTNYNNDRGLKSFDLYLTNEDKVESVNEYNESIPDKIVGTYKYDFNISEIHDLITKKFKHQKTKELKSLEEKIKIEKKKIKGRQIMIDRKASLRLIDKIKSMIDDIISNKDFNEYMKKITPFIEGYNILGTISNIISFAKNKKKDDVEEDPEDPETQLKRHRIIFNFIEIARKYIDIDLIRDFGDNNNCPACGINFDDFPCELDEHGIMVCACGTEKLSVTYSPFCKDTTRVNNSRSNYEDRKNFIKVLMRYQGRQPDKPPKELYANLDIYFNKHQLPKVSLDDKNRFYVTSEYIKNTLPVDEEGEKKGTSRSLMYKALKDTGNSKYYDHINAILDTYWGWTLDDVSHLFDMIMNEYDGSQAAYEKLQKDRKSSLNTQFRLFKIFKKIGHSCKSKNFKIPTTTDILEFHETSWKKMLEIGW